MGFFSKLGNLVGVGRKRTVIRRSGSGELVEVPTSENPLPRKKGTTVIERPDGTWVPVKGKNDPNAK